MGPLMEGASQIPATKDSTLRQLKPPHTSHIKGPISPRCLGLATYPNARPLTWPSLATNLYKPLLTRSGHGLPRLASFGSGNPAWERFTIKKPVRYSFGGPGHLYLTVSNSWQPVACSPPGSSVHGILQRRNQEWVAMSPPGDLPNPGIELESLRSPALVGGCFTTSTTWEALIKLL